MIDPTKNDPYNLKHVGFEDTVINHLKLMRDLRDFDYDDIDLELGHIKFKQGGGDAGHKGVRSISQHLGTKDFNRLRVGIGRPRTKEEVSSFVLSNFYKAEKDKIVTSIQKLCEDFEKIIQKRLT